QVYVYSSNRWGYDFCDGSFEGAVRVLEDDFERWQNSSDPASNAMASGRLWSAIVNGRPGDGCGASSGAAALFFSGADHRSAETLDLDVRWGGRLEFWLRMGPAAVVMADAAATAVAADAATCRPAYGGSVHLSYSADGGGNWTELTTLQTFLYRGNDFSAVEVELPGGAATPATRFRFVQKDFRNADEYWALDDVRVVASLRPDWKANDTFVSRVATEQEIAREVACCMNSDQCDLSRARQEEIDCSSYADGYSNERAVMGAELFVILAGLVSLFRGGYRVAQMAVVSGWEAVLPERLRRRRAKLFAADEPPPGAMDGSFALRVSRRWRLGFAAAAAAPLAAAWLWCASLLRNFFLAADVPLGRGLGGPDVTLHFRVHVSGLFLLATVLDALTAAAVGRCVV
ncbi:unnamed protein product, partial [Phaeothamnion confervicola]